MGRVAAGRRTQDEERRAAAGRAAGLQSYMDGGRSTLISSLSTGIVFPINKTVFRQQLHNTAVLQAVGQLYREGPRKLYRGVTPRMLMKTLQGTLIFGVQENLLRWLSASPVASILPSALLPALAGLGAGVVEALVLAPLERVQNVLQNGQNDRRLPTQRSVVAKLSGERLASGFYRAFLPIAARNALGSCLFFGLKDGPRSLAEAQGLPPAAAAFASGTLISVPVSLAGYPLSVLVANMQAQPPDGQKEGVVACWRRLWESRQRRVTLLYRGGSLVMLHSCVTWGVTNGIYEHLRRDQADL